MTLRKWPPDVADAGAKAWLESIAEDVPSTFAEFTTIEKVEDPC